MAPLFPTDPPGIKAAGNGSVFFVPAIADPSAPTVAEIEAGVDLSCGLYSFNISFEQTTGERVRYCYAEAVQDPGKITRSIDRLQYDYDPQEPDSATYPLYAELYEGRTGFIVDRRALRASGPDRVAVAAEQYVHVTPVTLGARDDRPIVATEDSAKLSVEQLVFVSGEKVRDAQIAA